MLTRMVYNVSAYLFCKYLLLQGIQKEEKTASVHWLLCFSLTKAYAITITHAQLFLSLFLGVNNAQIIKTAHLRADFALYMQVPAADLHGSCCSTYRVGQHTINHITFNVVKYLNCLNKTQLKYCLSSIHKRYTIVFNVHYIIVIKLFPEESNRTAFPSSPLMTRYNYYGTFSCHRCLRKTGEESFSISNSAHCSYK